MKHRFALLTVLSLVASLLVLTGPGIAVAGTRYTVTGTLSKADVSVGAAVTLSGKVKPRAPGQHVKLQRLSDGAWHSVATKKLSKKSHYKFRIQPTTAGVAKYRVRKAAGPHHGPDVSPATTLRSGRWIFLADMDQVDGFDASGGPVAINGTTYTHGLTSNLLLWNSGQHFLTGFAEFNFAHQCRTVTGIFGQTDTSASGTTGAFETYTDGVLRSSDQLAFGQTKSLALDVSGALRFRWLWAGVATTSFRAAWAAFGDARAYCYL